MQKIKENQILVTGGSGLLGTELQKLLPNAIYPSLEELDITNYDALEEYLKNKNISLILHAAAATATHAIEKNSLSALTVNIVGTANVVRICMESKIKLFYICTDYVFDGKKGRYKETDPVFPLNKYAWSKLGGECAVRLLDDYIIIRTSFGPTVFPYDNAYVNQFTSKEPVGKIAEKIAKLIKQRPDFQGVVHIGGERKSIYEYAKNLDPERKIKKVYSSKVEALTRPQDASLNTSLYKKLFKKD